MKKYFLFLAIIAFAFTANAQPREKLDELKAKIEQMQKSLAEVKATSNKLSNMMDLMKNTHLLNNDFFDQDMIASLVDAVAEAKSNLTEQRAGMKKFAGPSNQCNSGTECFKFKKDLMEMLAGIKKLNASLIGTKNNNADLNDKVANLVEKAPVMSLYPVYNALGSTVNVVKNQVEELSESIAMIKSDLGERSSGATVSPSTAPPGIRGKGPNPDAYFITVENESINNKFITHFETVSVITDTMKTPVVNFNSELTTMQLSQFCQTDRSRMAKLETATEAGIILLQFVGKLLQEFPEVSVEVGGSFVAHGAAHFKANIPKMVGVIIESAGDGCNLAVDRWKSAIDDCEAQRNQKIILDNQMILLENQVLLFQELEKIK